MKKVIKFGIIGFVLFIIIAAGSMTLILSNNMREIRSIPIEDIDFTSLQDGTYEGMYYYGDNQIGATVEVTISSGKIDDIIMIDHITGKGDDAVTIIDRVISQQTLKVDAISSATTSSHVIKLAIQDALEDKE
jgi:uncharacterized protein with FMN-binding domain